MARATKGRAPAQQTKGRRKNPPRKTRTADHDPEKHENDDLMLDDTDLEMSSEDQFKYDEQGKESKQPESEPEGDLDWSDRGSASQPKRKPNSKLHANNKKRTGSKRKVHESSLEAEPRSDEEDNPLPPLEKQKRNVKSEQNVPKKIKQKVVAQHQRIEDGILQDKLQRYLDKSHPLHLPESPDFKLIRVSDNFREEQNSTIEDIKNQSKSQRSPRIVNQDKLVNLHNDFDALHDVEIKEKALLQEKFDQLNDAYNSLMEEKYSLQKKYDIKCGQYQAALKRNSRLQERVDTLEEDSEINGKDVQKVPQDLKMSLESMAEENRTYKQHISKLKMMMSNLQSLYKTLELKYFTVVNPNGEVDSLEVTTPKSRKGCLVDPTPPVSPPIPSTSGTTPRSMKRRTDEVTAHASLSKNLFKQGPQKQKSPEKLEEPKKDDRFPRSFTVRDGTAKLKKKDLGDGVIVDADTWAEWMKQKRPSMCAKSMLRHFYSPDEIAQRSVSGDPLSKTPRGKNSRKQISPDKANAMKRSYEYYREEKKPDKDGGLNLYLREEIKSVVGKKRKALEEKMERELAGKGASTSQHNAGIPTNEEDQNPSSTSDDE